MKKLFSAFLAASFILTPIHAEAAFQPPDVIPVYTSDTITGITVEEFDMVSKVVQAEAGNQEWEAQWMVACVILNRVESEKFPETIEGVIYQENPKQFCCVWDGGYEKAEPDDAVHEAVAYALEQERIPQDILFFTSNGYLKGTEAYEQVDDMYFSR